VATDSAAPNTSAVVRPGMTRRYSRRGYVDKARTGDNQREIGGGSRGPVGSCRLPTAPLGHDDSGECDACADRCAR
jgi:hypothetical protein